VSPQINALATLLILAVGTLIVSATLLMQRAGRPAR
jgi:ABC-type spermidine/putrescine transport system permease subunit II